MFHGGKHRAHLLNDTGALLWQLFDGTVTIAELASDVTAVFDLDHHEALDQIQGSRKKCRHSDYSQINAIGTNRDGDPSVSRTPTGSVRPYRLRSGLGRIARHSGR